MTGTRTALGIIAISQLALAVCLALTYPLLQERVATHFDLRGAADAWMSREMNAGVMFGVGIGMSLFLIGVFYSCRYFPDSWFNLPHRDFWLAPERREDVFRFLLKAGLWLAALQTFLLVGIHLLVVAANRTQPAQLSSGIWLLLAGFLTVIGGWTYAIVRRFRRIT